MDRFKCCACDFEWNQEPAPSHSSYDGSYLGESRSASDCARCGSKYSVWVNFPLDFPEKGL